MREHETSAPSLGAVPAVATEAMKRAGTALALRIGLSSEYGWHEYMADLWATMLAAVPPTAMAEAVASARAEGVKEGLERAAAKAEEQFAYWRKRMAAEKCLEDGVSEDGESYTPIGDNAAWSGGYCNGRLSEADWWRKTFKYGLIPGGSSDV